MEKVLEINSPVHPMITLFATILAFLSFSSFKSKKKLELNPVQVWLITFSAATMSLYICIADGNVFLLHATDDIYGALLLAIRRVTGFMAVMSIVKHVIYNIVTMGMYTPSTHSTVPAYAKAQSQTRY